MLGMHNAFMWGDSHVPELTCHHLMSSCCAGRWKGVAVAIKVVDHMTAAGNAVDAARESVLSTSVQHPNVVSSSTGHA